jgi:hypothetical protein
VGRAGPGFGVGNKLAFFDATVSCSHRVGTDLL